MKTLKSKLYQGLVLSAAVWATACSEVKFDPAAKPGDGSLAVKGPQVEAFNFDDEAAKAKVDVLFVVDNSESMLDEQTKLSTAFSSFTSSLGQIDWQMAMTTTDVSAGPHGIKGDLVNFKGTSSNILTKNTPNFAGIFSGTVVRDELQGCDDITVPCPSPDERPLEALVMAMQKKDSSNSGFFRSGADLAVVILSDEDEGSNGLNAIAPLAVLNTFQNIFGTAKSFSAYGIVIRPGDFPCYNSQVANAGKYANIITAFTVLTRGVTGSICANDYGPTLASIGNRVREMVKSISLKYVPDPATVKITFSPADPSLTWTIEGNTVIFNKVPARGTKMEVTYDAK